MMKNKIIIPTLIILVALIFLGRKLSWRDQWLPSYRNSGHDCLTLRVGLDVGSGGTRFRSAVVDRCEQRLLKTLVYFKVPLDFLREGSEDTPEGRKIKTEFMDKAETLISDSVEKIKKETTAALSLPALKEHPDLRPYQDLADGTIEVGGVATASLRKAMNGAEMVARLEKRGIPIKIIPQEQEGHLAFAGVQSVLGFGKISKGDGPQDNPPVGEEKALGAKVLEAKDIIVWDIGGGSSQIVGYGGAMDAEGAPLWNDFDSAVASVSTRDFVAKNFKGYSEKNEEFKKLSPNPLLPKSLAPSKAQKENQRLHEMVRAHLKTELGELFQKEWWKTHRDHFFGIGGVHGSLLGALRKIKGDKTLKGYSAQDLDVLLGRTIMLSDEDLSREFEVPSIYTGTFVTNILLVKILMTEMALPFVEVLDVDNTQGSLISPQFWN